MIAELEAEVEKQALLRNHEVVTSLLLHNNTFICSYGKLRSLQLKLYKKIDKLDKSRDYCDIIEKEDLIKELNRCNMNLVESIKCGSCCFCSPTARAERVRRPKKQPKKQTFANYPPRRKKAEVMQYFDEYCKLMSEAQVGFDPTEARKELNEILEQHEIINPDTFEPETDIENIRLRLAMSEKRIVESRISAIGFEPT